MDIHNFNPFSNRGGRSCNYRGGIMTKKLLNKLKHCENGNICQKKPKPIKKLKILHLNKGSKFLTNSNDMINDLIIKEDPDIFSMQSAILTIILMKKK